MVAVHSTAELKSLRAAALLSSPPTLLTPRLCHPPRWQLSTTTMQATHLTSSSGFHSYKMEIPSLVISTLISLWLNNLHQLLTNHIPPITNKVKLAPLQQKLKIRILAYHNLILCTTHQCHLWTPPPTMFPSKFITNGNKTHSLLYQLIPSGAHSTLSQCIGKPETEQISSPGPTAPLWMSSGVTRTTTWTCTPTCAQALTLIQVLLPLVELVLQTAIHQNSLAHQVVLPTLGRLQVQAHTTTDTDHLPQPVTTLTVKKSRIKFIQHSRLLTPQNSTSWLNNHLTHLLLATVQLLPSPSVTTSPLPFPTQESMHIIALVLLKTAMPFPKTRNVS
jgi:hypothetical protein